MLLPMLNNPQNFIAIDVEDFIKTVSRKMWISGDFRL